MSTPVNYTTVKQPGPITKYWKERGIPEPFPCACGCGKTVTPTSSAPLTKFFNEACKATGTRKRQQLRQEKLVRLEEGKKALRKRLQEEAGG